MKKRVVAVVAAFAALAIGVSAPSAQTTTTQCRGTLTGDISGDVRVPFRATCVLDGANVSGNVSTAVNAFELRIVGTSVGGNVECGGCRRFELVDSQVGGTLEVDESPNGARVCSSQVGDAALVEASDTSVDIGNTASDCGRNMFGAGLDVVLNFGPVSIAENMVGGDLRVDDNREGVTVTGNMVGGSLTCAGNDPAPTGSGNLVGGEKSGQCAEF
jgi:hypothetical protein